MIQLPLEYQSGTTFLADLNPEYYITNKKHVIAKLTADNAWAKPIQRIAPIDFIELSETKFKELNEPYDQLQEYLKTDVAKHGNHDQSTHGNRRSGVSSTVVSDTQRFTADWGGLSINMVDGSMPTAGFMVAKPPEFSKIVDAKDFFDDKKGPKILADYMKANKNDLATGKNYLGTWLEEAKVYLDVSENIMDKAEAKKLGQERNQLAIYDVVGKDSIKTGGTGNVEKGSEYSSNQGHLTDERERIGRLRSGTLGETNSSEVDKHLAGVIQKHGDHDQKTHGNNRRATFESPAFSDDEYDALTSYSGSATVQINHQLRGFSRTRGIQPAQGAWQLSEEKINKIVKKMDSAIDKSVLSERLTLEREIKEDSLRSGLFSTIKGKTISDKGFLSLRKGKSNLPPLRGFVKMRIVAPAGSKALDLSFINPNAMGEVIFPRDTKIKVTQILGQGEDTTVIGEIVG